MYVNRDFVPLKLLPVILLWLGMWLARGTALHGIITFLALVYSVFWFAYVPAGWIRNYNQLGDYSFGTYIYAFPIQQSIIFVFGAIEPLALCALAIACTLPFAIVSWHLIEKNALGLKGSLSRWVHSHAPVG